MMAFGMLKTSVLPFQVLNCPSLKVEGSRLLKCKALKMELTITQPDDWHLHLRDGDLLQAVVPHSASCFGRAIVMPNLKPPITTTAAAVAYRESILKALPADSNFSPLMTLYLTDTTSPNEIKLARESGVVSAVKLYPAGATTNSQDGVTDLFGKCLPVLEEMAEQNIPLLVHGEVTDPNVDIFDREKVFIDTILQPLIQRLPQLKVVMEHITTLEAVRFVESCSYGSVAATVTPQHLLLNRNAIFQGGLQPHNYCLPVLKREIHRQAIVSAVTSGNKKFFLGTDSAPHEKRRKECACGCAGIYNAPVAISLYAKVFEEAGALDKLEAFTSFNGPDFYGLPRNKSKIKLTRTPWKAKHLSGNHLPFDLHLAVGEINYASPFVHLFILLDMCGSSAGANEAVKDSLMLFKYKELRKATKNFSEKLGEGGFGSVFIGTLSNSTAIAVKQLRSLQQGEKQFITEVKTIGTIQHNNVVRLRGLCVEAATRFLVYDYMPNGSLETLIFRNSAKTLDWNSRHHIAVGTARGLAYLHEGCRNCIIHCDIKPQNILLDAEYNPKVADLGLAKILGQEFSRVLTTLRGTRGDLALEWISGEAVTPKADVFSYGMLLCETISGRRNSESFDDGAADYFPF
ncbi:unnamed protein product [Dovyalis caffra]|uniref:Dihydroorotase, mitochondrial n=1 Tax=Dovyalis caffra TaxID=77055 RepID=A0AAV1QMK0_9ROSI|nr:unnamed protein product [Dovyalis caffra]